MSSGCQRAGVISRAHHAPMGQPSSYLRARVVGWAPHRPRLATVCSFMRSGFTVGARHYGACGVQYHSDCICVGSPFRTRKRNGRGASYPDGLRDYPFVCELCTTRANLGRELQLDHSDMALVGLERMRMIDAANSWTDGTLTQYRRNLRRFHRFRRLRSMCR